MEVIEEQKAVSVLGVEMTPIPNRIHIECISVAYLFKDQHRERFVGYFDDQQKLVVLNVRSREFRAFAIHSFYRVHKTTPDDFELKKLVTSVDGLCEIHGKIIPIQVRCAWFSDQKEIAIDGLDKQYLITSGKWEEFSPQYPIFKRNQSMRPLAEPLPGGEIRKIFDFVNIKDDFNQILFLCHLVFSFVPGIPHPILILYGPQGSSKSTAMKFYSRIVDPNSAVDIHSYNEMDFQLAAIQKWVIGMDNISSIKPRFSDMLCKIVTGMGFSRRILYTTDEMMIVDYMRVILINGINLPVEKSDLLDRSILISLDRIDNSLRKSETLLSQEFEKAAGEILGGCFDTLAKAMSLLDQVSDNFDTRMTDFGKWGGAIALALGYPIEKFQEALRWNSVRQNEESLDASPIVAILQHCFGRIGLSELKGTPTDLLRKVREVAEGACVELRMLPSTPRILGKRLNEIKPNLEAEGYRVSFSRGEERVWTIEPPQKIKDEYAKKSQSHKMSLEAINREIEAKYSARAYQQ